MLAEEMWAGSPTGRRGSAALGSAPWWRRCLRRGVHWRSGERPPSERGSARRHRRGPPIRSSVTLSAARSKRARSPCAIAAGVFQAHVAALVDRRPRAIRRDARQQLARRWRSSAASPGVRFCTSTLPLPRSSRNAPAWSNCRPEAGPSSAWFRRPGARNCPRNSSIPSLPTSAVARSMRESFSPAETKSSFQPRSLQLAHRIILQGGVHDHVSRSREVARLLGIRR